MTKDDFQEKCRRHVLGVILDMTAKGEPDWRARALDRLPRQLDSFFGAMWDALQPKEPVKNGHPAKPKETTR